MRDARMCLNVTGIETEIHDGAGRPVWVIVAAGGLAGGPECRWREKAADAPVIGQSVVVDITIIPTNQSGA